MEKQMDFFDRLPPQTFSALDDLGYEFLRANGYDTEGAKESSAVRQRLKKELKKRGEALYYFGAPDSEKKGILLWYELHRLGKKVAVSQGIKLLHSGTQREKEGTHGSG